MNAPAFVQNVGLVDTEDSGWKFNVRPADDMLDLTSWVGTTTLFAHYGGAEVILTRTNGGVFNLQSIDLAELPSFSSPGVPINFGPFNITFTGHTRMDPRSGRPLRCSPSQRS
jgi:hypothetical protein